MDRVPINLEGVRLQFKLNSPVSAHVRIDVAPDFEGHGPLSPSIHVDGGAFGHGTTIFDVPLTAVDKLESPLRHDAQFSVHVLDLKTAMQDRNTRALCLWSNDYRIQP